MVLIPGKSVGYRGIAVTHGREPSCGSWKLKLGPTQEHNILLTVESPPQPQEPIPLFLCYTNLHSAFHQVAHIDCSDC